MTKIIGSAALTAPDPEGENLTTKGDLHGYSSENTRIPIGDDDTVLTADSGEALGLKWAAAGGGQMVLLDSESLGSDAANITIDSINSSADDYAYWIVKGAFQTVDGGENMQFRLNNGSGSYYGTNMILNTAGTLSATTEVGQTSGLICTSNVASAGDSYQLLQTFLMSPQNATNTMRFNWYTQQMYAQAGSAPAPNDTEAVAGIMNLNSQHTFDKVDYFLSGGSDFLAGSNIQVYGVKSS